MITWRIRGANAKLTVKWHMLFPTHSSTTKFKNLIIQEAMVNFTISATITLEEAEDDVSTIMKNYNSNIDVSMDLVSYMSNMVRTLRTL